MSIPPLHLQALTAAFALQDIPVIVTPEYPVLRFTTRGCAVQMTVFITTEGLNVIVDHVSASGERGSYTVLRPNDAQCWHVSKPYIGHPPPIELCWTHEFGPCPGDAITPPEPRTVHAHHDHPTSISPCHVAQGRSAVQFDAVHVPGSETPKAESARVKCGALRNR